MHYYNLKSMSLLSTEKSLESAKKASKITLINFPG